MSSDGFYRLDDVNSIIGIIQRHTGITERSDRVVKVLLVPNSIQFWNKETTQPTNIKSIRELRQVAPETEKSLDIGGGYRRRALYTHFDGKPLSARSATFQSQVAELFVRDVLSQGAEERISEVNPEDSRLIIARLILEDWEHLNEFLEEPTAFLVEVEEKLNVTLSSEERAQIEQASSKKATIYSFFDYVELGESLGDGDTYILVGTAVHSNVPTLETMMWLQQNLAEFMEKYGYLPGYGSYVTEAALRQRVIMGPDVSERELKYITNNVFDVHDCREGQSITRLDLE